MKRKRKLDTDTGLISLSHDSRNCVLKCLNKGQVAYTQATGCNSKSGTLRSRQTPGVLWMLAVAFGIIASMADKH